MKVSDRGFLALFYCQRYGLLTVEQLAFISGCGVTTARKTFVNLGAYVGWFGNVGISGKGKTPKVYYLTAKGYEILTRDSDIPIELIGRFKQSKGHAKWSSKMLHRLQTVQVMLNLEKSLSALPNTDLVQSFIEYKRQRENGIYKPETSDIFNEKTITPDGAFILKSGNKRLLFFIEIDQGTERITSRIAGLKSYTLQEKLIKYDEYLQSGAYSQKYREYGDFDHFSMLFITNSVERLTNIKKSSANTKSDFDNYYFFSTFEQLHCNSFFAEIWQNRAPGDSRLISLLKE